MFEKKNINKVVFLFLITHLIIWTLAPSLTNVNLPLDTIEALAWGSNLDWGFNKHPPFSAFAVNVFYNIFGSRDWVYYLLSQIFVLIAFISIFKLGIEIFRDKTLAFLSILILESIFFYNYTSPEFNVNISQLPFWALSILFTWRCAKNDKLIDYILLGIFLGLGFLSKYIFLYLVLGIVFFYTYLIFNKKLKSINFLITPLIAFLIIFPHLIWLAENNLVTLKYGIQRTGADKNILNHIIFPVSFIVKQLGILIPFFIMSFFLVRKIRIKNITFNEKIVFLNFTFIVPIVLVIVTSLLIGGNIRTMWMTPFYLLSGIMLIQIFRKNIVLKKLRGFFIVFLFFFFLSPSAYIVVSLKNDFKRTDYQGKEIARLVQNKWNDNFSNDIKIVVGDEWFAGNLSYHLSSRPKWLSELKNNMTILNDDKGVIYTGNPKILKKICPGVYGTIKPVGYCMIGRR